MIKEMKKVSRYLLFKMSQEADCKFCKFNIANELSAAYPKKSTKYIISTTEKIADYIKKNGYVYSL